MSVSRQTKGLQVLEQAVERLSGTGISITAIQASSTSDKVGGFTATLLHQRRCTDSSPTSPLMSRTRYDCETHGS